MARAKEPDAEVLRLLEDLDRHTREGTSESVIADLRAIKKAPVYSQPQEIWKRCQALKAAATRLLVAGMPAEAFCGIMEDCGLYATAVYEALDGAASGMTTDHILSLVRLLGPPAPTSEAGLYRRLVDDPSAEIPRQLESFVRERCAKEADAGASFTQHMKTMASFQYIRWGPDDGRLSSAVALLAERTDPHSVRLTEEFLLTLPWGGDRQATWALVEALDRRRCPSNKSLIARGLEAHRVPGTTRLVLFTAYGEYEPQAVLMMAAADLKVAETEDTRFAYIDFLQRAIIESGERRLAVDFAALASGLSDTATSRWSFLSRGCLGLVLRHELRNRQESGQVSSVVDRAAVRFERAFERVRIDHMAGCMLLPVIAIAAFGLIALLGLVLGAPPAGLAWTNFVMPVVLLTGLSVTMHTHFSGNESMKQRFILSLIFWGAILLYVLVPIVIRLPGVAR